MSILELVSKSLEQVRQELFDRLTEKQAEYAAKGWLPIRLNLNKGVVRGLIELWAWGLSLLYQFLAEVLKQAFADTATGGWLDLHCKQVGVTRKPKTKTTGTVFFLRAGNAGNVLIPAGRIVKTKPDAAGKVYRYVTLADVVLPDGATEVAVAVEAEEYGQGGNASTGQISEIATVIDGVDTVENRADWLVSEGVDVEDDEALRKRYFLAWQGLSGCTKHAYAAWALEVPGTVAVTVLDQHPRGQGTVDVVIKGAAGMPTQLLIDAVAAKITGTGAGDELAPINDDVLVKGPTPVLVDIVAELELIAGDAVEILAAAEARERALFDSSNPVAGIPAAQIGQDGPIDLLKWPMMGVTGVKRINMTSPAADVVVPADGLMILNSIALSYVWAAEA